MNASNLVPITTSFPRQLSHLADQLAHAADNYSASPATDEAGEEAATFVAATYLFFRKLLPGSSAEVHDALVSLCISEVARQRLETQAASGTLPGAQVLDIHGDPQ